MPALTNLALAFAYNNSSLSFTSPPFSNSTSLPVFNSTCVLASNISSIPISTNTPTLVSRAIDACIPPAPKISLPSCPGVPTKIVVVVVPENITVTETRTLGKVFWSTPEPEVVSCAGIAGAVDGLVGLNKVNVITIATGFVGDARKSFVTVTKTSSTSTVVESTGTGTRNDHEKRAPALAPTAVATADPTEANCDMNPEVTEIWDVNTYTHTLTVLVEPSPVIQTVVVTVGGKW